jgi:hypothetical protein
MSGLTGTEGTTVSVEYPNDSASKFIAIYGFEEFFESLPDGLERFDFVKSNRRSYRGEEENTVSVKLPSSIGRFTKLHSLHLEGIVDDIPKDIVNLKELVFLSLPNNPNLKELPKEVATLENLQVINLKNSGSVKLDDEIENKKDILILR